MSICFTRGFGAAIAYVVASHAAHADLAAQDVWADWKSYLASAGYSVSGDETSSGNGLTVDNMALSMLMPDGSGTFAVTIDTISFTENGDGTVAIAMPGSIPMMFEGSVEGEEPVKGVLTYTQTGNTMVASGTPQDLLYTYTASQAAIALSSLTIDGTPVLESQAKVSVTFTNIASSTRMQLGELRTYVQRGTADSLDYDIAFIDPETQDNGKFKGAIQGVAFDGSGAIPLDMDPSNFNQMLADGFAVDGAFTYASGNSSIQGVGDGQNFSLTSASQGGEISVTMDASKIAYDVDQKQTALNMSSSDFPLPIDINAALSAFKLSIPVAKSDTEQDFSVGMTLSDFTMSDMLWSMFDPAAQLPRDPATIALDLTGKVKMLFDFLDPNVAASLESSGEAPAELNALTINKLLVSMVGASVSGTGDFTFDNSDKETFDGMPRPMGHVDLDVSGANGLLDKLTAMGFIGDQEVMGARMMMTMLAVPGDSPDTLKSKIEINEQGHVLANGQRIK